MTEYFKFLNIAEPLPFEDAFMGSVHAGISNSTMLLRAIADALSFPPYFGENWNALFDCLRDFHWTNKRTIVLVHEDVPSLPRSELKVYLEVLKDAALDWKAGEPHELIVVFDERTRNAVIAGLED